MIQMETIRINAQKIIHKMRDMQRYSFEELERFTALGSTELCLALMSLLKDGIIKQNKDELGVYYALYPCV